ncbi:MAG: CARDB domain-containing protein, partial [Paracoccaceae bacterium]
MTDVNGAVTGVDGAENVVVTLYYLAEGAGFPVGGVDTLAALTADADLELGSVTFAGPLQAGAASDSVTIAEAAILTAVGASNDAAGRVYAVVSSFDLVDAVNDVADVTPAADITFDALEVQSADLQVSIALAEVGSIAVGEDVRVDYTMTNAGDVDADDAVVTFYWEDANGDNDVVVGSATGDVNAGATRSGHIAIDYDTLVAEVGDHASEGRIYAVIDAADAVEEILNEGNNTAAAVALTFDNPNSLADLTVYDLSISDSALDFGEDLSLRLKFGNDDATGYADATGVVLKVFDDTDTLIHTEAVGDLELGSFDYNYTFDVDFGALRAADAQSIYVTIEGAEDDLSAANDTTASVAITVDTTENLPELDITAQEINGGDHADIAVGTDILWTYAVTNSGDLAAYDVVTTFYVADDAAGLNEVAIGTDKNYTLSIGETDDNEKIYLDYEDIKQYSGKFFYARVDATDDVDESDDTAADNQSTPTQLTFAPEVADLKVNAFTTKGYDAVDGITIDYEDDKVTLKLKIENEGTADFAGASTSYYFSTNDTLELDGAGAPDGTDTLIGTDVHGLLSAGEVDGYEPFTLT